MSDSIQRGWLAGRSARWLYAEVDGLVRETGQRHGLTPGTLRLTGELIAANVLLMAWVKGEDRATLQLAGTKPTFTFYGEIDAEGALRARMTPRHILPPEGLISAQILGIRSDAQREVYRGTSAVENESVELAFERHLRISDQVDVAVRIVLTPAADGQFGGCRALLIERMPEEPGRPTLEPEAWKALRLALTEDALDDFASSAAAGSWRDLDVVVLETTPLVWRCRCSDEKVHDMLLGLGGATLRQLATEDHGAEVTCHFCEVARRVSEADLLRLAAQADAPEAG